MQTDATLPISFAARKDCGECLARVVGRASGRPRVMDYCHAVVFAADLDVPVYGRLGFRQTGARIDRYLWRNTQV